MSNSIKVEGAGSFKLSASGFISAKDPIQTWNEKNYVLRPLTLSANDNFGWSVAMSGDKLAVGSYKDDGEKGAVYTYTWNNGSWGSETKLTPLNLSAGDQFGWSIAMSSDKLVIGAKSDNSSKRAVYVYTWNGTQWDLETKLTPLTLSAGDSFGISVSLSGDKLAVGSFGYNSYRGAVYTYTWNNGSWGPETKLSPNSLESDDYFGWSVSLSGDKLAIGAYWDDGDNNSKANSGAVYTYTWNNGSWGSPVVLRPNVSISSLEFGISVSLSGDNMIVGGEKVSAYIYKWNGTQWGSETKLSPSSLESGDKFGRGVAISGDRIAIGAYGDDGTDNSKSNSGAVYNYVLENSPI